MMIALAARMMSLYNPNNPSVATHGRFRGATFFALFLSLPVIIPLTPLIYFLCSLDVADGFMGTGTTPVLRI